MYTTHTPASLAKLVASQMSPQPMNVTPIPCDTVIIRLQIKSLTNWNDIIF